MMGTMTGFVDLRPSLTVYLFQRVSSFQDGFRHNLALVGPPGSGKSTLIQHLLRTSKADVIKIACALDAATPHDLLRRWVTAVLRGALNAPWDLPLEAFIEQAKASLPKTAEALQPLERHLYGPIQGEVFAHALDLIAAVHADCRRPCLLVLDEILRLEELVGPSALHELGKRVMTWPFTLFLVTSSSPHRAREVLRERFHVLFGQLELMEMPPPEKFAAISWMHQKLAARPSAPLSRFLLHWAGPSTWYVTLFVNRLQELTILHRTPELTEGLLSQAVWDVLGHPSGPLYQAFTAQVQRLMRLPSGTLARDVLIAIADGARTGQAIGQRLGTRRNLSPLLRLLVEQDIIHRHGSCWMLSDQVFATWLTVVLAPSLEQGAYDPAATFPRFDTALRAAWSTWLEANALSLADRVQRLFGQFRNETVLLNHKLGRLPVFERLQVVPQPLRGEAYLLADGEDRRWACLIHDGKLEEPSVSAFDLFCRTQSRKPVRKIVISKDGLELNAKLLAKESSMWIWEGQDVNVLLRLFGQPTLDR